MAAGSPVIGIDGREFAGCDRAGWIITDVMPDRGEYAITRVGDDALLPVPDAYVDTVLGWQRTVGLLRHPNWITAVEATSSTYTYELRNGAGEVAIGETFPRRIELAASASSPGGRYLVHAQANNQASVVTVLDALGQESWTVSLQHDASLAAYAISVSIDRSEGCVAIGQVRADGSPAESWFIDLETRTVAHLEGRYAVAWAR